MNNGIILYLQNINIIHNIFLTSVPFLLKICRITEPHEEKKSEKKYFPVARVKIAGVFVDLPASDISMVGMPNRKALYPLFQRSYWETLFGIPHIAFSTSVVILFSPRCVIGVHSPLHAFSLTLNHTQSLRSAFGPRGKGHIKGEKHHHHHRQQISL